MPFVTPSALWLTDGLWVAIVGMDKMTRMIASFKYPLRELIFMTEDKRFERVWKAVENVRKDPETMKLLNELIKKHTS